MNRPSKITTLFLDIGGVLLTDGWPHAARMLAAGTFDLDPEELEIRHHQVFDTYESGKLRLKNYLDWVVFHQQRGFTPARFQEFMFAQSRALPGMIELIRHLKTKFGLRIIVVSNEGRELNAHRIHSFHLNGFVDAFISSCFVHLRKPDPDIFRLALDIAQVPPGQIVYLENTPMFIQIAADLGIQGLLHREYASTRAGLARFGLTMDPGGAPEPD